MNLSRAYANADFIPGGNDFPVRWADQAAAFRAAQGAAARLDLPYGSAPRQRLDLFLPKDAPRGLLIFVHGGYWMAFGRETWSHLAAGALARGWACAMPSYTLAPQATISQITAEVAQAVVRASGLVPGPIVVTGHSAGGHLAARMACADRAVHLETKLAARLVRVVPISPLADLAPLMQTDMNADLKITDKVAVGESPALWPLRAGCQAHVWVGGQERPAFLWQARTLSESWNCRWTVAPDKHHFDVIDDLADPASALVAACLGGLAD